MRTHLKSAILGPGKIVGYCVVIHMTLKHEVIVNLAKIRVKS